MYDGEDKEVPMQGLQRLLAVSVILGLCFGFGNAYAITLEELLQKIKTCAPITDDTARLAAYDALAESLGLAPPLPTGDTGK